MGPASLGEHLQEGAAPERAGVGFVLSSQVPSSLTTPSLSLLPAQAPRPWLQLPAPLIHPQLPRSWARPPRRWVRTHGLGKGSQVGGARASWAECGRQGRCPVLLGKACWVTGPLPVSPSLEATPHPTPNWLPGPPLRRRATASPHADRWAFTPHGEAQLCHPLRVDRARPHQEITD